MSNFPEFNPLLLGIALVIGYVGTFLLMAASQIAASSLPLEDKVLRMTALICCPPVGLLVHMDNPPVRDVYETMRRKGWLQTCR